MKNLLILGFCTMFLGACEKQSFEVSPTTEVDKYQTIKIFTEQEGRLIKESDQFSVIITKNDSGDFNENDALHRFVADNLPAELKEKKKVKIVFSGELKQYPYAAQSLMVGRPLKLTKIRLK
ncbi:hypothetical protein [Emticicia agri]|uniref:Uncharacterized protein n=1 Tax=Emticicia agri TaxID=2492393 RepID=A0A4Q5M0G3_9BACT|nr:hypothetical protein [Emticicia agri]RYU95648.1 hypothetical protein EWM59_11080 [Emticicia agri]